MASQGPNSASVGASSSPGTFSWIAVPGGPSLGTAISAVGGSAAQSSYGLGIQLQYLVATGFGFSIPAGSTILGVVAEFYRKMGGAANDVLDSKIFLVKGGTIMTGTTNKSAGAAWLATYSYISFGGAADLWGNTLSDSDVNASNFGVAIAPIGGTNFKEFGACEVDHIRITITYSAAAGGSPVSDLRLAFL